MGVAGTWDILDRVQEKFHKKVLRIPRTVTNGAVESKLVRESKRGKTLSSAVKYWARVKHTWLEELVRQR